MSGYRPLLIGQHSTHTDAGQSGGSDRSGHTPVSVADGLPRSILRRRHPDGIRAWTWFRPNAPGSGELRSVAALQHRQLLKMQGLDLSERVLVVVGRDSAAAWVTLGRQLVCRCVGRWHLDELLACQVAAVGVGDPLWPAFGLWNTATGCPASGVPSSGGVLVNHRS